MAATKGREEARRCPRCEGTGRCVDCQGTGHTACPTCGGQGQRVTPRGQPFTCRTCNGSGKITCPTACPSCNGTGSITEKFQAEIKAKYTVAYDNYTPSNKVVAALVALNVVVYLLTTPDLWPFSLVGQPIPRLILDKMLNTPDSLTYHDYWRFVTPMFVHWSFWHLGMNMAFLLSVGPALEGVYGWWRFLILYLLCGIAGVTASWLWTEGLGAGASSALYGVGACMLGLRWRWGMFDDAQTRQLGFWLVALLVLGFVGGGFIRLDNWAHLGGGVMGLALGYLGPRPRGH